MTRSDAEIAGRKSPLSLAIRLGSVSATAALLLVGSGAKADVIGIFDVSGSFQVPSLTFTGTIDLDFTDNKAKAADITVDGLPAYNQNPYLYFVGFAKTAVVYASDSNGDVLSLDFNLFQQGTLAGFTGGKIIGGDAVQGVLLTATGSMSLEPGTGPVAGASVPEPSTWAMMLLGFAGLGLGAAARHARRTVAFTMTRRLVRVSLASVVQKTPRLRR